MYQFDYAKANTLEEACKLLAEGQGKARVIAGGTDLMVQIHEKDKRWKDMAKVVDISGIAELSAIEVKDGMVHVGALVTHTQAEESEVLKEHAPLLADACRTVGGPQIRNKGTLGGAIGNGSPASDPMPALIALDACAIVCGTGGERQIPLTEIIEKPGKTVLEPDEIIREFVFPSVADKKMVFVKLGRRKALSISRMNVSVIAKQDAGGAIEYIRVVPGCVFATPAHAEKAEAILSGQMPDAELIQKAADSVAAEMIEKTGIRWSTEYKEPVIKVLVRRALSDVLEVK